MTDYFKKYPVENSKIINLMRTNSQSNPAMEVSNTQDQDPLTAYSANSNKDLYADSTPSKLRLVC